KGVANTVDSLFKTLFGTSEATHTDQQTQATAGTNGVTYSTSDTITPTTHLGPGEGDLIEYISNVRLVAAGWNGQATTAKLSDDGIHFVSVHYLKERLSSLGTSDARDPVTGLDRTTIQALLGIDPLANGGPNAPLDPNRFAPLGPFSVNGGRVQEQFS